MIKQLVKWICFCIYFSFVWEQLQGKEKTIRVNTLSSTHKIIDTSNAFKLIRQSRPILEQFPDSGIFLLQQALNESYQIGSYDGMAYALLGLGVCDKNKGKYQESIYLLNAALFYAQKASFHKEKLLVYIYNAIGASYVGLGNYQNSISYFLKALARIEQQITIDPQLHVAAYSNLGGAFAEMGQYDFALHYLKKMEHIALEKKYPDSLLEKLYYNIAITYERKNDFKNDSFYTEKLIHLNQKFPSKWGIAHAGQIALLQNAPQKAINLLEYALKSSDTSTTIEKISWMTALCNAYYLVNDYKHAEETGNTALMKSKATSTYNRNIYDLYHLMVMINVAQKKYKSAYENLSNYVLLQDSLLNEQNNKTIHLLEIKYRTSEKDKDIAEKKALISQQERSIEQRNMWLTSTICGSILLISLMSVAVKNYRHRQKLQQEKIYNLQQKQDLILKEKEIDNLKAMVNGEEKERGRLARELHDGVIGQLSGTKMILNTLQENAKNTIYDNNLELIIHQLKDSILELREIAHNLTPDILLQQRLSKAVQAFCEKSNQNTSTNIFLHQPNPLPVFNENFELSVYRIIQELIHNIEKHARATEVFIQIHMQDELLSITVEDNGIGMDVNQISESTGIGLKNIASRIKMLNGNWDIQSTINSGTTVYIEFDTVNYLI